MADADRATAYAEAFFAVDRAEDTLGEVEDELFRLARVLEGNDELRGHARRPAPRAGPPSADRRRPARRQGPTDHHLPGGVWWSGTAGSASCPRSWTPLVALGAASRREGGGRGPLGHRPHRRRRPPAWPRPSARPPASPVEVKVIVDPTVQGGIVAQVGDTVIDGSVRRRLEQLRDRPLSHTRTTRSPAAPPPREPRRNEPWLSSPSTPKTSPPPSARTSRASRPT